MEEKYCHSCSMPMGDTDELYGTEKDGSKSADYCKYCYEKGEFTFTGSMDEMIEMCVPFMTQSNPGMSADAARDMMRKYFPLLKRWSA